MPLVDALDRPLRSLRVSVTDRCNLRCQYCMPEDDYTWLPRSDVLTFEEVERLVRIFVRLGVDRVRVTGGEPLLRRDVEHLVAALAGIEGIADLAMTTNGVLLAERAAALRAAGLDRVTVSLDTLRRDRFRALARFDELPRVLAGIDAAVEVFGGLKLDTVVVRGVNDDEMPDLVRFARSRHAEVRFIEYMDVGGATRWSPEQVFSRREMLDALRQAFGPVEPIRERSSAPAARYRLLDGTTIGVISSTTQPFCRDCDRSRLTADGVWLRCLYATRGTDLRARVRGADSDDAIADLLRATWEQRDDRGAERRLALADRGAFVPLGDLRRNAHLEMHTRGG